MKLQVSHASIFQAIFSNKVKKNTIITISKQNYISIVNNKFNNII